jgi:hypothetical protein
MWWTVTPEELRGNSIDQRAVDGVETRWNEMSHRQKMLLYGSTLSRVLLLKPFSF